MQMSFEYESRSRALPDAEGTYARLKVLTSVYCTDRDGDYSYEIDHIIDLDRNEAVTLESLPETERASIENKADRLAYENSPMAYEEYCEGRADVEYERWKDEQMFREREE